MQAELFEIEGSMISYKDKTFCQFYESCGVYDQAGACGSAYTPEVKSDAEAWWGKPGAPVCFFANKPWCWEPILRNGKEQQ